MPEQIPIGIPTTIQQNVVYALPSRKVRISVSPGCSTAQNFTGPWVDTPGTPTPAEFDSAASFIKCQTGSAVVTCK